MNWFPTNITRYEKDGKWTLVEYDMDARVVRQFTGSGAETDKAWDQWDTTRSVSAPKTRGLAAPDTTASVS